MPWGAPRSLVCKTLSIWCTGSRPRCSRNARRGGLPSSRSSHPVVQEIAQRLARTPAQVALAWTLGVAPNVLLIPGTSSRSHLEENMDVASIELDDDDRGRLNAIAN